MRRKQELRLSTRCERLHVGLHHSLDAAHLRGSHEVVDGPQVSSTVVAEGLDGNVEADGAPVLEAICNRRAAVVMRTVTPSILLSTTPSVSAEPDHRMICSAGQSS